MPLKINKERDALAKEIKNILNEGYDEKGIKFSYIKMAVVYLLTEFLGSAKIIDMYSTGFKKLEKENVRGDDVGVHYFYSLAFDLYNHQEEMKHNSHSLDDIIIHIIEDSLGGPYADESVFNSKNINLLEHVEKYVQDLKLQFRVVLFKKNVGFTLHQMYKNEQGGDNMFLVVQRGKRAGVNQSRNNIFIKE